MEANTFLSVYECVNVHILDVILRRHPWEMPFTS